MSKLYIPTLALVLVGGGASAQHAGISTAPDVASRTKAYTGTEYFRTPVRPTPAQSGERVAFWSEDFSDGALPAGWTTEDLLTPVGGPDDPPPAIFEWSDDPDAVAAAAAGQPLILSFLADGASNGYLWVNSDRGLPSAPGTEHLSVMTTSAIDCSGQPTVQLSMQSTIGAFDNDPLEFCKIKVSTNGTDWTDFFPFPCLTAGGAITPPCSRFSDNPETVNINISSVAANQPTVYLQFEWQGLWEYYWAIDDLELSPLPPNEIQMSNAFTSQTGTGEEYGRVPLSQARPTINFGASIYNYGGEDQTNVTVTATVTGPVAFGPATATEALIEPDSTFFFDVDQALPGAGELQVGQYTVDFTMTSDQIALDLDPTNNSGSRHFSYTTDVYSCDAIGLHPEGIETLAQVGSGSFTDNTENVKLLNYYEIYNNWTVTGVEIALGPATGVGSSLLVSILDTADVLATPAVVNEPLVESTTPYVITQADIDAGVVTIAFDEDYPLTPNAYYVVASCFAGTDDNGDPSDVFILDDTTVPQPALMSALWIPFDPPDNINFYGGNGTAWAVRLTSAANIGVREVSELEGVSMYPNPTNGILNINTTTNEKFTVEVMNVLGELMMTTKFTGMTTLDLAGFADGVYSVRISNGTSATVQRVTLN
ncbi:MAG TPA: T9SS type A sorting domain-containing protein [Flavobacteriales bacterium]|nr:T9SS type A sorting domain-containing protein [Flavobacteriales bacterium]